MNFSQADIDRFWKSVNKTDGCWNWTRCQAGGGYGSINIKKKNIPTHRFVWMITKGEIPNGFYVMNTCKNKLCCNPEHLVCAKHHGEQFRDERFFSRIQKTESCWNWTGKLNESGYGMILVDYKQKRAHRHSYEIHVGPIPPGIKVLHHCDNPKCVRPDHLFLGTQGDNNRDMHEKGRNNQPKGEASGVAVLTKGKVVQIRAMRSCGITHQSIANTLGVSEGTVSAVISGRTWRHVK